MARCAVGRNFNYFQAVSEPLRIAARYQGKDGEGRLRFRVGASSVSRVAHVSRKPSIYRKKSEREKIENAIQDGHTPEWLHFASHVDEEEEFCVHLIQMEEMSNSNNM